MDSPTMPPVGSSKINCIYYGNMGGVGLEFRFPKPPTLNPEAYIVTDNNMDHPRPNKP